jgi:peptide deformylase
VRIGRTDIGGSSNGVGLQIFVYEIGEDSGVFINPSIELGDEMQEGGEVPCR